MAGYWKRVIKPKLKRKLKELPREIAHKKRLASIKLEKKLARRREEQARRKRAFEAEKRKLEEAFERGKKKEVIRLAEKRGRKAARIKVKPTGLKGFAYGLAGELGTIREVYGPPRPVKKKGKVKKRKSKKRKSKKKKPSEKKRRKYVL